MKYKIGDVVRVKFIDGMFKEPERQLLINEDDAKELYKTASVEFKSVLEDTFGKEFFVEDIREKVTNAFQASEIYIKSNELAPMEWIRLNNIHITNVMAYSDALVIADVLNEGWKPDWNNMLEMKWSIGYHNREKSFKSFCNNAHNWGAICFKSKELSEYFIKQFPDICKILYGGTK